MAEFGDVRLNDLQNFQSRILKLSKVLDRYHELVVRTMKIAGQNWRDNKYVEFEREFRQYQDEIKNISEEYKTWALNYLQKEIDNIIDFGNTHI